MRLNIRSNKNLKDFLNQHYPDNLYTESKDMRIRSFNIKRKEEDLEHLRDIYNDAFSDNWHFIPVSKEEYIFSAKYLHLVTPPDLIKFVEYRGTPIGVVQLALDINPALKEFKGKLRPLKSSQSYQEQKKD